MTKEFILTSTATTFTGVGVYSESNSDNNDNNDDNNDDDNDDDNDGDNDNDNDDDNNDDNDNDDSDDSDTSPKIAAYIGIGVASIVLLSAFIPLLSIYLL